MNQTGNRHDCGRKHFGFVHVSKPSAFSSPSLPRMQPEDSTALRLQPSNLQRLYQATMQRHAWSHVHLRDTKCFSPHRPRTPAASLRCIGRRLPPAQTHHSALLVGEVDADRAAGLGVGHLAVIRGATLAGEALDHGWGDAGALELRVLHSKAVAEGLPCSLKVLH